MLNLFMNKKICIIKTKRYLYLYFILLLFKVMCLGILFATRKLTYKLVFNHVFSYKAK